MLRSFIVRGGLIAFCAVLPSCKKANTDEGGTRSDGGGAVGPVSEKLYSRAVNLLSVGKDSWIPQGYASPLVLNFDAPSGATSCVVNRVVEGNAVFALSPKCPFDEKVQQAAISFQQDEKKGIPQVQMVVAVASANGKPEAACGGANGFVPRSDLAQTRGLAPKAVELINAGGLSFFNPATGAILIIGSEGKFLASGMDACTDRKPGFDVAIANWKAATDHDPYSQQFYRETKDAFFRQVFLSYAGSKNNTVDDPTVRPTDEAEDISKRAVEELFSKELRTAVVARINVYPMVYPVKDSPIACIGYGLEMKKILESEPLSFSLRGGKFNDIGPGRRTYQVDGWDISIAAQPTPSQKKFAHSVFVAGVFTDALDSDSVFAMSPSVRPVSIAASFLYDCSADGEPICGVMRGAEVASPTACPRLTIL